MLLHYFLYSFKEIIRTKEIIFWTLVFPIALATFMYIAFGNVFEESEVFHELPVAVIENAENENFTSLLDELDGSDGLIKISKEKDLKKAEKLLKNEELVGIYVIDEDEIKLIVKQSDYKESVLDTILTEYERYTQVITDAATKNPQKVQDVAKKIMSENQYVVEKNKDDKNYDMYTTYFYAIFAMSCLFAGYSGVDRASRMQANTSALGMRRCLAPNSKLTMILVQFFSSLTVQFAFEVIAFLYMKYVLGVEFCDKYPAIMLILLMGSGIGLSMGMIIGCMKRFSVEAKVGIVTAISMTLSVFADLVANGVRNLIEHSVPFINRINPAALIVDSFYALSMYDDYTRFFINIGTLGIIIVILLVCSFLLVRRTRYESV